MTTTDPSLAGAGAGTGTPAAGTTGTPGVVTPTTAATPQTPATADPPKEDSNWLKPRLERERKAGVKDVLKEAGFESIEDAKAASTAAKAAADANKTATQKAAELTTQLAAEKARADSLSAIATEHAARMMVGLTAEQQAAVKVLAGEDPAKQLATIGALAPTWAKAAASTTTTTTETTSTAPAGGAPSGTTPAPTTPRAIYEAQRSQNPFAAAQFGADNPQVYSTPK